MPEAINFGEKICVINLKTLISFARKEQLPPLAGVAGVQLRKPLIRLGKPHLACLEGWGSTLKTSDTLVAALKTGFKQAVSGVFALKKLQPHPENFFYVKCSSIGGVASCAATRSTPALIRATMASSSKSSAASIGVLHGSL
jgi:hypothetical protein